MNLMVLKLKPIKTLKTKSQFDKVFNKSARFAVPAFVIFIAKTEEAGCLVGYSVSKKVGNAVVRNKVKRRFKEAFKRAVSQTKIEGDNFIIIARKTAIERDFETLIKDFCFAIKNGSKRADSL